MKKLIVVLLLVSLLMVSVFAQDKELGYREAGLSRSMLYPEGNFYDFPSRLNLLEKKLLRTMLRFETNPDYGDPNDTQTQVGGAQDGGTLTDKNNDLEFELDGSYYFRMNDMVLGVKIDDDFSFETVTDSMDNGFTSAGDTLKVVEKDNYYNIRPELFFAMPLADMNFGARVRYSLYNDPVLEEFEQRTDSTLNGGEMYYNETIGWNGGKEDRSSNNIQLQTGVDGKADSIEWGASLYSQYFWRDNITYVVADSDGDGFGDTLMDDNTYITTAIAEGGLGQTDGSIKDQNSYIGIKVFGYGKIPISDNGTAILTAEWTPFSQYTSESYYHNDSADKSISTNTDNHGLLNMGLTAAYALDLGDKWSIRTGAGYRFQKESFKYTNLDSDGNSTYSTDNINNFNEVGIGAIPADQDVWDNGNNSDYFFQSIPVEFELRFIPAEAITLFSTFTTRFEMKETTKSVYNTDDNSVWTETESSFNNWTYTNITGGIDLALTDSLNILFTANYWPQPLRIQSSVDEETLPSGGSTVTGVTTKSEINEIDVQLNFVFRF